MLQAVWLFDNTHNCSTVLSCEGVVTNSNKWLVHFITSSHPTMAPVSTLQHTGAREYPPEPELAPVMTIGGWEGHGRLSFTEIYDQNTKLYSNKQEHIWLVLTGLTGCFLEWWGMFQWDRAYFGEMGHVLEEEIGHSAYLATLKPLQLVIISIISYIWPSLS